MDFGLNLFSLRTLLKDEAGFLDTANKLRDMGYSFLQFSGCPYDADMIARVSRESGMPIVLTHVPMTRILNDADALMEEHARFNCNNIGLGMMDMGIIADADKCRKTVAELNAVAEKMKKNGFNFFYHNHHFEFFKHNGQTVFDYMIENAPAINFTLDTYWVQYGGADLLSFIEKLNGRIGCVHLKDYRINAASNAEGNLFMEPKFAPVGDGTLDFGKIIDAMKRSGAKYFLVEQDNAVDFDEPLEQVKRSINYLKKEF